MSANLILWLPEDLAMPWAWLSKAGEQGWATTPQDLRALSDRASGPAVVILPGTWVRVFPHSLPDIRASERQAAAAYSIEDQLAAPVQDQHIVLSDGDDQRMAVISRARMDAVMAALEEAELTVQAIYADFDVLSASDKIHTAYRLIYPGPLGYALDSETDGDNPLLYLPHINCENSINLASGPYGARQAFTVNFGQLKGLAACLLAAGLGGLIYLGAQGYALNRQADDLREQTAALYTSITGQPAPANPAQKVRRAQRTGQNVKADFLSLSSAFFEGLRQVEGVEIDSLRFNDSRNELVLKLIYPGFDSASALESVLNNEKGQFRSGAVREQGDAETLIGEAVFNLNASGAGT